MVKKKPSSEPKPRKPSKSKGIKNPKNARVITSEIQKKQNIGKSVTAVIKRVGEGKGVKAGNLHKRKQPKPKPNKYKTTTQHTSKHTIY